MQPAVRRPDAAHRIPLASLLCMCGVAAAISIAACGLLLPTPAAAQSLLQSLFGIGSAPPPRPQPLQTFPMRSAPHFYGADRDNPGSRGEGSSGGSYRTVCVRMCDGYYWPISHGVSRSAFTRDARACQSSCGADARLFYHPVSDTDGSDMADLGGRAYTSIPNAFRYRKALVPGCACKPAPWTEAALARHQRYAGIVAPATPTGRPGAEPAQPAGVVIAGGAIAEPQSLTAPVERPAPLEVPQPIESRPGVAIAAGSARPQGPRPPDTSRTAAVAVQPQPRPAPRPEVPHLPAQVPVTKAKAPAKPSAASKPVYSHDLGRFLFPGEGR